MDPVIKLGDFETGLAKALQLYVGDTPVLVLADAWDNSVRHSKMLEQVLSGAGIAYEITPLGGREHGPKSQGENYELAGASRAIVREASADLEGRSDGYEIGPSQEHAEAFRVANPDFVLEITHIS
jgi:hypothetical protein